MALNKLFDFSQLKEKLDTHPKIVITTHINPDGDAVGSLLGLYNFFKKNNFKATAIVPNEYPGFLQWMPGQSEVIDFSQNKDKAGKIIAEAGIVFQLDYNDEKRSGDMKDALSKTDAYKVMIDHHPFPKLKNHLMISITEASSTSELIFEFISALYGENYINQDIAECLYTGIMTDTGNFNYNSSRPRTFEIASVLLKNNIRKDEIFRLVYDNFSEHRMRFLGYCLNEKMQVIPEYKTAFIAITVEEQERFKFTTGDSEGFVNYPLSIKGVVFTAFFTERKDKVKISFRSQGSFPANIFAEQNFGGGGHTNAAGGESNLSLTDTVKKFVETLPKYKEYFNQ